MTLLVHAPGLLTTVQDLGRPGLGRYGVPVSGAMDPFASRIANWLVGNDPAAALLEITASGPEIEFVSQTPFALTGGDLSASLAGAPVENWTSGVAAPGDRLTFGARRQGARAYLAIGGGILVPEVLGSRSTDLESRIGGGDGNGQPLRAGQRLETGSHPPATPRFAPFEVRKVYQHPYELRFLPSPSLPAGVLGIFSAAIFRLGPRISRMGYRLEGPPIELPERGEMLSEPIPSGTIQLPPGAAPILLMADRQTVGGYPRLGSVIRADIPRAAQLFTGHAVRFLAVTAEEARAALLEEEAILARLAA